MFKYLMAFFALVAVAFAVPQPEANPNPKPQVYGVPYAYSAGVPVAGYASYAAPAVYASGYPAAYTYY